MHLLNTYSFIEFDLLISYGDQENHPRHVSPSRTELRSALPQTMGHYSRLFHRVQVEMAQHRRLQTPLSRETIFIPLDRMLPVPVEPGRGSKSRPRPIALPVPCLTR